MCCFLLPNVQRKYKVLHVFMKLLTITVFVVKPEIKYFQLAS